MGINLDGKGSEPPIPTDPDMAGKPDTVAEREPSGYALYEKFRNKLEQAGAQHPELGLSEEEFGQYCHENNRNFNGAKKGSSKWFLTVAEAAQVFDVDQKTIRRLIQQKDLCAQRVGRILQIPAPALVMYYEATMWSERKRTSDPTMQIREPGDLRIFTEMQELTISHTWNRYVSGKMDCTRTPADISWEILSN